MGFSNEQRGGGGKYINFRKGKLVNNGEEFLHFTGLLVDMDVQEDEYEGKKYNKITLYMVDEDNDNKLYHVQMAMNSGYGVAFMSMLPNIDVTLPFEISPGMRKGENTTKEFATLFVNQGNKHVKWFYKNTNEDAKKRFPAAVVHKVGKEEVKDYTKREEFMEKMIVACLNKKLRPLYKDGYKSFIKANVDAKQGDSSSSDEWKAIVEDENPFD